MPNHGNAKEGQVIWLLTKMRIPPTCCCGVCKRVVKIPKLVKDNTFSLQLHLPSEVTCSFHLPWWNLDKKPASTQSTITSDAPILGSDHWVQYCKSYNRSLILDVLVHLTTPYESRTTAETGFQGHFVVVWFCAPTDNSSAPYAAMAARRSSLMLDGIIKIKL